MKRMNLRNTLSAALLMGGLIAATSALAQSQGGHGWGTGMMSGEYGGMWLPILLVVVVVGLVAWFVAKKRK